MLWLFGLVPLVLISPAAAQALEKPDGGEPGDEMIQEYLRKEAVKIESSRAGSHLPIGRRIGNVLRPAEPLRSPYEELGVNASPRSVVVP